MMRIMIAFICVLMSASGADAQSSDPWDQSGGWRVRHNDAPEFWRLYHPLDDSLKKTIVLVWADRRDDVSMAQAFEEQKVRRGEIDNCPALITAETRPEYDPFAKAMLALTKIKDPDAYAAMDKDLPIIGYEAADDERTPHCVLVAREFVGGAMLYALILDKTDTLATRLGTVRNAARRLMDDINEKEAPATPAQQPADDTEACEGAKMNDDWILTWSPKTARVYVRNPQFVDAENMLGKRVQLGFNIGGKVDAGKGREDPYLNITIAAEENEQEFVPEKLSLSVDNQAVQEWGKGGAQWAALSNAAVQSLMSGANAELSTTELGRIRFQLNDLQRLLKLADIAQHKAVIKTRLGECES